MGAHGNNGEKAHCRHEDSLPFASVLERLLRRWVTIAVCAAVGVGVSVTYYFYSVDKYTARVDFVILETPLGGSSFIQAISTSFLKREVGGNAHVAANSTTGVVSVTSRDLRAEDVSPRLTWLKSVVLALGKFLDERTASRYRALQQDMLEMPNNPAIYSMVDQLRTYVTAEKEGFFEQVSIKSETSIRQGIPLYRLIGLGFIGGGGLGLLMVLLAGVFRNRSQTPVS